MPKFTVWLSVTGTAVVTVEAENVEDAKKKANDEYSESPISICHQCADNVSDPTYGEAVDAVETE